jgi:hypothetical protein
MAFELVDVGVVVARRKLAGPWADHAWTPVAVLPAPPPVAPWTPLGRDGADELFYVGPAQVTLHAGDTAHYRENLQDGDPRLWVVLRPVLGDHPVELVTVTADPFAGEGFTEAGGDIVEAVPMPADVAARLAAFFEAHHVERSFVKRKRDRADPEALARGRPRKENRE